MSDQIKLTIIKIRDMTPGKIYTVTPDDVDTIKLVWGSLNWIDYEYEFNNEYTKFRKRLRNDYTRGYKRTNV